MPITQSIYFLVVTKVARLDLLLEKTEILFGVAERGIEKKTGPLTTRKQGADTFGNNRWTTTDEPIISVGIASGHYFTSGPCSLQL